MKSSEINSNVPYRVWCEMGTRVIPSSDITKLVVQKDSTASDDIQLGYACASSLKLSINNSSKVYSDLVFKDKEISVYCEYTDKIGEKIELKPLGDNTINIVIPEGLRYENQKLDDGTYNLKYFDNPGTTHIVKLGVFNVDTSTKNNNIISLECTDAMVKFDTKWLGGTFPMSLYHLLELICNQVGVELENDEILNGDFVVVKGTELLPKSCRQIVALISELCGSFAFINSSGKLEMKWYNLNDIKDELNGNLLNTFKREENNVEITGIEARIGSESVQFGNNLYQLEFTENNELFDGSNLEKITPVVENVWKQRLEFMEYLPCNIKCKGNPSLEIGDVIKVTDDNNIPYFAIITSLTFSDNFSMNLESVGKSINDSSYTGSTSSGGNNNSSKEVRFAVGRNYNAYEITTDTKQNVASIVIGTDAETMVLAGISLSFELLPSDTVTGTTNTLIELVVNGMVYHTWTHVGNVGRNEFGCSLIPFAYPLGQATTTLRISANNRIIKLAQYNANLSLLVRGGEVTEAPAYPEINISQRFTQFTIGNVITPIVNIGESLEYGNNKYDSKVFSEIFRGVNLENQDLLICRDNDYTKLLHIEDFTISELSDYTLENISDLKMHTMMLKGEL